MSVFNFGSGSFHNVFNEPYPPDSGVTGPTGPSGGGGSTGPQGPTGPGAVPMQRLVEGIAFGETSVGRTLLGFGVDDGSNNIGLWCSSTGQPQDATNSSSAITAFMDTSMTGANMLNGIYLGEMGSIAGSNLSNSLFMQRQSMIENQSDWTQNTLLLNAFTANPTDSVKRSIGLMNGQFVTDSQFDQSILIGDMDRMDGSNVIDALCIRTPGPVGTLTMADNTGYIGNGQVSQVMSPGDFMVETYNHYFLKTLALGSGLETEYVTYDSGTGELTTSPIPAAYILPVKQPTVLGGQYGLNSLANGSEINGRNSFNNYTALPGQLTGVCAVGNALYQASTPASNTFTNDIFLGRSHQFPSATSIQNSLIAASIVGNGAISRILDCNMIVPRAASLTFGYTGEINGANFCSSGNVACTTDPLYSSVFSSGGTVNPGQSNLVISENLAAGSIIMSGSGNTLITSSSNAQTYNWPAGINNTTVIRSGTNAITPTQNGQFAVNHTSFLAPNIPPATSTNSTFPIGFSQANGTITYFNNAEMSRVLRRVGTTNASGQIVFSTGVITPPANAAINLTIRNTSTTVSYNAQVIAIGLSSFTVQVFNSVTGVLASPSMTPSGAGIIVHATMAY